MTDYTKRTAGLALLMAAPSFIPQDENGADAKADISWNGETLHFRLYGADDSIAFDCTQYGLPTVAAADGILKAGFEAADVPYPLTLVQQFKALERGEHGA